MYVPKSALVTLVTLSCDVVLLMTVTRLVSTGLPSRSQEKLKVVVPTQSPPVQVSVRGSPTLRSGSEGVTCTDGGAGQWIAEGRMDRAKEGTRIGSGVRLVQQHLKHAAHLALAQTFTHTHVLSKLTP